MWEVLGLFSLIYFGCKFSLCSQACTLLLSVLFVYDVFFVFITPFLTNVRGSRASLPSVAALSTLTLTCLLQSGESIMVEVAAGPSDFATHEKVSLVARFASPAGSMTLAFRLFQLPMVLKVPRLNSSPLALCDRPFSLLGFGDILVPGNRCVS